MTTKLEREYHKQTVAEGLSKGKTQRQLALLMQVSVATVNRIVKELRAEAKANIQHYINEELPLSYQNTLVGINQIIAQLWNSIEHSINERDKVTNTSLLLQAYGMRLELLSSAETLKHTVSFVDSFSNTNKQPVINKKEVNKNTKKVINNVEENNEVTEESA